MDRLWSPWRSEFIKAHSSGKGEGSPFLRAWESPEHDQENFLLYRGERAFIILNRFPYNAGHLLVLPVRQIGDILALDEEESGELMRLVRFGVEILTRALKPHGFNVGLNLGRSAGAAFEDHVHFHIVPRWNGDANFMPVLGETRVISESMEGIYRELCEARDEILAAR